MTITEFKTNSENNRNVENILDVLSLVLNPHRLSEKLKTGICDTEASPLFVECCKHLFLQDGTTHDTRKIATLKFLVLQFSAYFDWNLDRLIVSLPTSLLHKVFETLFASLKLNECNVEEILKESNIQSFDKYQSFALCLYCKWILKTSMEQCIPSLFSTKDSNISNMSSGTTSCTATTNITQMTNEENKLIQAASEVKLVRLPFLANLSVSFLEAFLEKKEETFKLEYIPHSAFSLNSNFTIVVDNSSSFSTGDELSFSKDDLLLILVKYYLFTENYSKSRIYCSIIRESPLGNLYGTVLGLDDKKGKCSLEMPSYQLLLKELESGIVNEKNFSLRKASCIPYNMNLLRSNESGQRLLNSFFEFEGTKVKKSLEFANEETEYDSEYGLIMKLLRETTELKSTIDTLSKKYKINVLRLSVKWKPDDSFINNNKTHSHDDTSLLYVISSKMTQLRGRKDYRALERLISQNIVYSNTFKYLQNEVFVSSVRHQDKLDNEALSRLKELLVRNMTSGASSSNIVFCLSLLNNGDWDFIVSSKLSETQSPVLSSAYHLSYIATHFGKSDVKRHLKAFEDSLIPLFSYELNKRLSSVNNEESKDDLYSFILEISHPTLVSILSSFLIALYNGSLDDTNSEISNVFSPLSFSLSSVSVSSINVDMVIMSLKSFYVGMDINWNLTFGDISLGRGDYVSALKYYMEALALKSNFFYKPIEIEDKTLRSMIKCSSELNEHVHALILTQFLSEGEYTTAFRSLEERNVFDGMDICYPLLWDITVLEYAVTMHSKRGELSRKRVALENINLLELNTNNNREILNEASHIRKSKFLRRLSTYLF